MHWLFVFQHWLAHATGSYDTPGSAHNYNFWSGFGSDLGELTIITALIGTYFKHNCHMKHCLRIGRHVVNGTPWCNKHHEGARQDA